MIKRWMKAEINEGMFSIERTVTIFDVEGVKHQFFVQTHALNLDTCKVAVDVLEQDATRALVSVMTSHGWENVTVSKENLEQS